LGLKTNTISYFNNVFTYVGTTEWLVLYISIIFIMLIRSTTKR
jgi:hypothetical protein